MDQINVSEQAVNINFEGLETSKILAAADITLENTWNRTKPVLQTATGGAIILGSALFARTMIDAGLFTNFMYEKVMSASLAGGNLAIDATVGFGGLMLTKQPVKDAFNFFKNKFSVKK